MKPLCCLSSYAVVLKRVIFAMPNAHNLIYIASKIPDGIKTGWLHVDLPPVRYYQKHRTYNFFSYEELPPITRKLDEHFDWLRNEPAFADGADGLLAEGCYGDGSKPDLGKLNKIIELTDVKLPDSFVEFILSPDLHQRIRSCTDCYLDVADYPIRTIGQFEGQLIHFLSDSQWCLHWYLFVSKVGSQFVITSPNAYGFDYGDANQVMEIDLEAEDEIWFCAPSFNDFIYRFWLENEVWFRVVWDKQPLASLEADCKAYVEYYLKLTQLV